MRRRTRPAGVDADRLASVDPDDWLDPAERARVVDLVDDARRVRRPHPPGMGVPPVETVADRLAPGTLCSAVFLRDRDDAVRATERLVVRWRRDLAGWRFAVASGESPGEVAARFGLGRLSRPDADDDYWLATGPDLSDKGK